jgi:drug/metabolite transporter (DMT)-like permease
VIGRGVHELMPPVTLASWRWGVALCVLLPFALGPMIRERAILRRRWKILLVLGVLGVGSFNTLVYIGLSSTTATNGLLLNSAIPVLIVLLGWLFLGQRVTLRQALGILVSLCGVAAIVFKGELGQLLELRLSQGDLWVFAAMVVWAVYTLLLRRTPAGLSPIAFLGVTVAIGFAANLPFLIAYVGVFPSVIAYLFWNRAVAEVGARRSGMFVHLMPVFGALLAYAFLGESLHGYHLAGIALILAGITLAAAPGSQSA